MVGRAGGVLVHGAVLDSGDVLQPVVCNHPDAGRLLASEQVRSGGRITDTRLGGRAT
jgi:hypothetical protein